MNDRPFRPSPTDSHQNGIEGELAAQCGFCRPADDPPREEIHHHREVEPAFPCSDVRYVGNPRLIRLGDREVALQDVWREL